MKSWVSRFNTYFWLGGLAVCLSQGHPMPAAEAQNAAGSPSRASRKGGQTNATATASAEKATKNPARSRRKVYSTLQVFVETQEDGTQRCQKVPVDRVLPVQVVIDRNPVLVEEHLAKAEITEVMGGFAITLRCNERGIIVLDAATTSYRGQRLVIFSNFGSSRYLAAPVISRRIRDGVLTFTPDATREEAERIVEGLNNTLAKVRKRSAF